MKLLGLFLFCSMYAAAQMPIGGITGVSATATTVAYVASSATCASTTTASTTIAINYTPVTAGDALVILIGDANSDTTWTVTGLTDNGGTPSTYTPSLVNESGASHGSFTLGGTTSVTAGVTTITATLSAAEKAFICVNEYSGVSAFGNTFAASNATVSATASIGPITLQHSGEYAVGAWGRYDVGAAGLTLSATSGTLRQTFYGPTSNYTTAFFMDLAGSGSGAVTMSGTLSGSHSSNTIAVELMHP